MEDIKLFVAAKAFINHNGKILLLQESPKYTDGTHIGEFDVCGGRMKPEEEFYESFNREVMEETGLKLKVGKPFYVAESWPQVRGEKWHVVRIFFETFSDSDKVILDDEHDKYLWIDPKEYKNYNLIKNLLPVFEAYINR